MPLELRVALRQLYRRTSGALLIVLLTAVGVALSTLSFVVLHSVLLTELPYREADRLVLLWCVAERWGIDEYPFSWDNFLDYRAAGGSFEGIAASRTQPFTLLAGDRPQSVRGARVTADFLDVLGIEPMLGSGFPRGPKTYESAAENVALVSHRLWREELGGDADVPGSTIRLDGVPHTVVGVLPPIVRYPTSDVDVLVPLRISGVEERRAFHFLRLIGRLRPGASLAGAEAEVQAVAARLASDYPDANQALSARLVPLKEQLVGDARRSLMGIHAAVQLLLLIACGNVAGLLLVRGLARRQEVSVRLALGASRSRLVRQLFVESLVLGLAGGMLGLAAAVAGSGWLRRLDPVLLPRAYELHFDLTAAGYALAVTLLATSAFAVGPALLGAGESTTLRSARSTPEGRVARIQGALAAGQVAVTLLLLFGAGLLGRSVLSLSEVETGFRLDHRLSARIVLPAADYPDASSHQRFSARALDELRRLPGVLSVGALSREPFSPGNAALTAFRPDQEGEADLPNANFRVITPELFTSLGVHLLDGRDFTWSDDATSHHVVIVDQPLADLLWPDRSAVGQSMRLGSEEGEWEVVGVVPSLRLLTLDEAPGTTVWVPVAQGPFLAAFRSPAFIVHTDGDPAALAALVRETLQAADPAQAVLDVRPLGATVDDWLGNRGSVARLVGVVAGLALFLAVVGLYATLAFSVGQRRQELAIRAALGARPGRLLRSTLRRGLLPALLGIGFGLGACLILARWLDSQVYGARELGLGTLVATALAFLGVAALATLPAARRAADEEPARALHRS